MWSNTFWITHGRNLMPMLICNENRMSLITAAEDVVQLDNDPSPQKYYNHECHPLPKESQTNGWLPSLRNKHAAIFIFPLKSPPH